jgi:ectoine hydroxylase-related dioxygenase (phytanoyl-CoA dioxygenase family)
MELIYKINQSEYKVEIPEGQIFKTGEDVVLSNKYTDVTFGQKWYSDGYTIENLLDSDEFSNLKNGIENTLISIIKKNCINVDTANFTLEKYHKFVINDNDHFSTVSKTRDLFSNDFNFDVEKMIPKFEKILGFNLSDFDADGNEKIHIIIRINRPNSNDYNPPHKDMYEAYDATGYFPKFLNFWIPIAGVTDNSSLPIVPKSHTISENKILRTINGGIVGGNKYRVRFVKRWGDDNQMIRANVTDGDVLIFSSHLVHGLAVNAEEDTTRVALEFRLFKK